MTEQETAKLGTEWNLVIAARDALNIATHQELPVTYKQAIHFGAALAPSVLAPDKRLLHGMKESESARYYAEKSTAASAATGQPISRIECLEKDILELETEIKAAPNSTLLKGRLATLKIVRREITPKSNTENQLIIRDSTKAHRNIPITGEGANYKEFDLGDDRVLRICALHPDPPEAKIGADLIYEIHDLDNQTVRVAFLQYKRWDGKSLPRDPRMENQLKRMHAIGCDGIFCKDPQIPSKPAYRFPHCAMFLRPTDQLQVPDAKLVTSGLHIPLCVVDRSWETNSRQGFSINKKTVEKHSLSHKFFEDLFVLSMVGSNNISVSDLESLYQSSGFLNYDETIILHAQEFKTHSGTSNITVKKQKNRSKH